MSDRTVIPRHEYIGGSAASTVLGKNNYETRYELWYRKVNRLDLDLADNRHVMRGNLVEPIIEEYCTEHLDPTINSRENWERHDFGLAERRFEEREADAQIMLMDTTILDSRGKPFIGGHPDGVGDEILWEFKTPTNYKLERVIRDGIPPEWHFQILHYMMISGLKRGCLAMWSWDRWEPYLIWVEPDPFLYSVMRDEYARFWEYVVSGEEPPADAETQMEREHAEIVDDPKLEAALETYHVATRKRYDGQDEQKAARAQLMTLMGDRKTVLTPNWRASLTMMKRYGKVFPRLTVRPSDEFPDEDDE